MRAVLLLYLLMIALVPVGSAQDQAKRSMKGMELWSWRDPSSGTLQFSLLVGTNRAKNGAEIRDPGNSFSSVSELKQRLAKLAEGETVYWAVNRRSNEVPAWLIEDIVKFAENRNVRVVTHD